MMEAVLKLLYPEATLSEALRRVELVAFDQTLVIGETDEKPDGFIFRKTISDLYLVTNKSLVNIGTSQGLEKANLGWVLQKLVKNDLYMKTKGQQIAAVLENCEWEMAISTQYVVEEDDHFNLASVLKIAVLTN
jgi:hypothetical protein